jgi:hypothetical protein
MLEFARLLHRQIRWLFALENSTHIVSDFAVPVGKIGAVAQQAAGFGLLAERIDRGDCKTRCQDGNLLAPASTGAVASGRPR